MVYDTSVFIDYLRGYPATFPYFLNPRAGQGPDYCSVITEAELWEGIRDDRDEARVAELLSRFDAIPVTGDRARLAGYLLRAVSEKRAHFGDALIAATAILQGETVLTADAASQRVFGNSVNYLVYR